MTTETDNTLLELDALRAEISDLNARLIDATKEKVQAGQLGLRLLKEKEQLENEHEALIREYETMKIELDKTQKEPSSSMCLTTHSQSNDYSPSPSYSEDSTAYKIKVTELESKLKQIELVNTSLTEQLSYAQNELTELEIKHELLNNSSTFKVCTTCNKNLTLLFILANYN